LQQNHTAKPLKYREKGRSPYFWPVSRLQTGRTAQTAGAKKKGGGRSHRPSIRFWMFDRKID
jgi:hypothetical protein